MKKSLQIMTFLAIVFANMPIMAQQPSNQGFPYKSATMVNYGTDVLIQGNASEDQRNTKIAVASDGTLYSAYMISAGGYRVARSTDNGNTWTHSATLRAAYYINALDIVVTGSDAASRIVWVITSAYSKASIDMWDVTLEKLGVDLTVLTTTQVDQMISNEGFPDVAVATDFLYPSAGATPFSIGLLYSKIGAVNDHVVFRSSADGGSTFANTQVLASTGHYYINVALAFGRSPGLAEGRYFAAWDKQAFFTYTYEAFGQIYTSHSQTAFNSSWSVPARLDNIGPGLPDAAKNPSIACQADQVNNSSNAFSVVVMFEKLLTTSGSSKCVYGVGNLTPVAGSAWSHTYSSGNGTIIENEPDVTYDPTHQNFYVTWCDSLNAKLNCSVNDMNFQTGVNWNLYSAGYNDASNLMNPFPKVKVNPITQQLVNGWDSQRSAMIANATFDKSDFSVGIPEVSGQTMLSLSVSPNPCQSVTNLSFNLDHYRIVSAALYNLSGQKVWSMPSQPYASGYHNEALNFGTLQPAIYILQLHADIAVGYQRIAVIR